MTRNILVVVLFGAITGLLVSGCILGSKNPCDNVNCGANATCFDREGIGVCECHDGFHMTTDGCVVDGSDVTLEWVFGTEAKSCTQVLVTQVHVLLLDENETATHDADMACSGNGVTLEEVQDGEFTLELTGKNNSDEEIYFASTSVVMNGQDIDIGTIALEPIGFMKFSWTFGAGELDCTAAGVDRVKIMINNEAGDTNIYTASPVPYCSEGEHQVGNFYVGTYQLVLEGKCESDTEVHYRFEDAIEIVYLGENDYGAIILDEEPNGPCL